MAAAISIVGHGTDGSDGIARGIRLRWAIDDKLGFPACVRLFRRESSPLDSYILRPLGDEAAGSLKLPYKQRANGRDDITFLVEYLDRSGHLLDSVPTKNIILDNATLYVQPHDGEVRVTLSRPVPRIILRLVLRPNTAFTIEVEGLRQYQPLHLGPGKDRLEALEFAGTAIERMRFVGSEIVLVGLTAWDCVRDNGNDWEEIKLACGCGLPVDIKKPTNYIADVYKGIKDLDLATVLCRLDIRDPEDAPFTQAEFDEFRDVLRAIGPEGASVPVGWTRFPEDADRTAGDADVSLDLAQYDYLLVQSQLVATARALDLFYHDDNVAADHTYDYMVETSWPDDHKRRLDHVVTFDDQEDGRSVPGVLPWRDEAAFGGMVDARFEALAYPAARSRVALTFDCVAGLTSLQFVEPITEIQIWLAHAVAGSTAEITVSAFAPGFITAFETISVTRERALVRIEAPAIAAVRFAGARVAIGRIHYDRSPFAHGIQRALTCGLSIRRQQPLETPRDLQVAALLGGPVTVEGQQPLEKPQLAGLRWAGGTEQDLALLSIHPVAYHVQRRDRAGRVTWLTEHKPLLLGLDVAGPRTTRPPLGWPGRPYYVDAPRSAADQAYQVAAVDIFGRTSRFTEPVPFAPGAAPLATPRDVRARYLDPAAYDAANDRLLDPLLTEPDRDWLRDNGHPAIRVQWSWPAEIPAPSRDAEAFRIVFQEGWLNVQRGIVDRAAGVSEASIPLADLAIARSDQERLPILATLPLSVPALAFRARLERAMARDALRFCWLKQGAKAFLVLAHDAGRNLEIRVLKMDPPADATLEPGLGFAITVTVASAAFLDYTAADSWTEQRVTATVARQRAGQVHFEHLIAAPRFPDPPIAPEDLDPIRYGQVGVHAVRGETSGAVSVPATVMAVRRQAPQAAVLPSIGTALRASPADIHGKARFALRWPKLGNGVRHHVFRAMDESLFAVDRAQGGTGDYGAMLPNALQALASRAENERAFSQLTQQPLREDDVAFADRVALPEEHLATPPYQPDPGAMLFVDATLDGRSRNRYFYRLQAIDAGGLAGPLGPATPPVEIPRTAPPAAPVLTAIEGGDRRIVLRWVAQDDALISGYLVYRTDDPSLAEDWRRMTKVAGAGPNGLITPEELAVATDGSLEFADTTAPSRRPMHYRVLAVGVDDADKWLRSRPSAQRSGQAYDLSPPAPPVITSVLRRAGSQGEEIVVEWTCEEALACMVQRRAEGAAIATSSAWLDTGVLDGAAGLWRYGYVDAGNLNPQFDYVITVHGRSTAGNVAVSAPSEPV